jgi:hypothetical protein
MAIGFYRIAMERVAPERCEIRRFKPGSRTRGSRENLPDLRLSPGLKREDAKDAKVLLDLNPNRAFAVFATWRFRVEVSR